MVAALNAIDSITCPTPQGAFYVFPSCQALFGKRRPDGSRIESSDDWIMHLLEAQDLAALQGSAYGVPAHFRLSFAASPELLAEGCRRIAAARAQLSD